MLRYGFTMLMIACSPALADYGEQPLRGSLNDKPHFQTSLGREKHRFEKHPNNAYQLYDFYARQAQYYLNGSEAPKPLLLPYPGLEGGRRGHWGYTNERDSTAYHREVGPEFTILTGRDNGMHYIKSGTSEHPALCVFNGYTPRLDRVMTAGRLAETGHPFTYKIDRFGIGLAAHGTATLRGPSREWAAGPAPRDLGDTNAAGCGWHSYAAREEDRRGVMQPRPMGGIFANAADL